MHLFVIAASTTVSPPADGQTWVLRLVGTPDASEVPPPKSLELAELAARKVRESYPTWLWKWVETSGVRNLETWPGPVSWWWYAPASEMSPWRTLFIRQLYWITLLECVLDRHSVQTVTWVGDNMPLADWAKSKTQRSSIPFTARISARSWKESIIYFLIRRILYSFQQFSCWLILRTMRSSFLKRVRDCDAGLYSRYPILWDGSHERMYGTWPEFLAAKGQKPFYGAVYSGSFLALLTGYSRLNNISQSKNIVFLESLVSLANFISAHFSIGFFRKYIAWKKKACLDPVLHHGYPVTDLWWKQIDSDIFSIELPFDRVLAEGWHSLEKQCVSLKSVFFPFEFQPMERAIWSGLQARPEIKTIGLQAGGFCTNQMGNIFPTHIVRAKKEDPALAPLPDILVSYGDIPQRVFVERLGTQRVFQSGPIRYPPKPTLPDKNLFMEEHGLPSGKQFFFLAMPGMKVEGLAALEGAARLLKSHPELFLLIKFHYHLPLQEFFKSMAEEMGLSGRYRIFDGSLSELMSISEFMMTGGSSTVFEAMELGCMPIIYRPLGEMPCDILLAETEAAYQWSMLEELSQAVVACLDKSVDYERRRRLWPKAMADQISSLPGSANERLYNFLH